MAAKGAAPGAPLVDLREAIHDHLEDWRAEDVSRLLRDARRACKRWAPKSMPRADHDPLAADAVCLILQWETSGDRAASSDVDRYVIDCGRRDCAPPRAMWRASGEQWREPSSEAWIVLHRAIVQACKAPRRLGWRPPPKEDDARPVELPTDPVELERLRELAPTTITELGAAHADADAEARADYAPLPDDVTVSELAEVCELPLDAARALAANALGMAPADRARQWGMTEGAAKVATTRGARWIEAHYPDTIEGLSELARVLRSGAAKIRAARREALTDARVKLARGEITTREAQRAAFAYLESTRTAPAKVRALEDAATRAVWRSGKDTGAAPKLARAVVEAIDCAKVGEYARLAAPRSAPTRYVSDVPAPRHAFAVKVRRGKRCAVSYNVRRETDAERDARPVRAVKRARKFAPYIT